MKNRCYLYVPLKLAVVYIHPHGGAQHDCFASRFVASYIKNIPPIPHTLYIVPNGGPPSDYMNSLYTQVDHEYFPHDDSGWDIGAFQHAARDIPCDLMVFLGGTSWIKNPNWLERMVEGWLEKGEGVFGSMGNAGDMRFNVYPHIRTTGFWCSPGLMNAYPFKVSDPGQRYLFEHGKDCISQWSLRNGMGLWMVTTLGIYNHREWDGAPNGFHQGDQSALLVGDRVSDPPYYHTA